MKNNLIPLRFATGVLVAVAVTVAIFSETCLAYIPKSQFIFDKVVSLSGSGIYSIEQDVVFSSAQETLTLREIWQVDGEGKMRLTIKPPKELQDQIVVQNVYLDNKKYFLSGKSRQSAGLTEDFFEKYFHYRRKDPLISNLTQMKILASPTPTPTKSARKRPKKDKDGKEVKEREEFVYHPEQNVRLARHAGVVAYAFGVPTPVDSEPNPGLWIEQDQFFLRKFRLPSKVEISADNFGSFARGLWLPQQKVIRWSQKSVQINLVKVVGLPPTSKILFSQSSVDMSHKIGGIKDPELAQLVEEFYTRFR